MILEVEKVNVFRDGSHVLKDISINVDEGQMICIVGRNGAGKTTLLKTILGYIKPKTGLIKFLGKNIISYTPEEVSMLGIGYSPDDLRIFPSLTVEENIELPLIARKKSSLDIKSALDYIYSVFPVLKGYRSKPGTHISGGERRMLAIARALVIKPKLILLDEPFEGLAPIIRARLSYSLKLLIEQNIALLLTSSNLYGVPEFVNRVYCIERGEIIYSGMLKEMLLNQQVKEVFGLS
jgi:branched-chain amino acid transport system ATP-binding protein